MSELQVLSELPNVGKLIAKAAATSLGRPGPETGLPERTLLVGDYQQELERLAAYCRVCGFAVSDRVPATWLHVLTFPLQAQLMAERDFPFPLAGIVHVTNKITMHRPVELSEALRLAVRSENLQPHRKGVTFDLVGEIHVGEELVWSGRSNYLAGKAKLPGEPVAPERESAPEAAPSQVWRLPADLGRQYAWVSGDINPIHLHPLSARLFGFPRPIIHGMWTHARALAAFGGQLPAAYSVRVQFTKPILLPKKVKFAADGEGATRRFAVVNQEDKPYLVGSLREL